jgi:hypothetical protein
MFNSKSYRRYINCGCHTLTRRRPLNVTLGQVIKVLFLNTACDLTSRVS